MLINYLKIALRHLWKNRVFTAINIMGLAVSLSAALVIYLVVDYHFSFDDFHPDKDRIYRVVTNVNLGDKIYHFPGVPRGLYGAIQQDFAGIETSAALKLEDGEFEVKIKDKKGNHTEFAENYTSVITDTSYFNLFSYEWLTGSKYSLSNPGNIILTQSIANKYFGSIKDYSKILGRTIQFKGNKVLTLAGVVRDFEQNSEFDFKAFISDTDKILQKNTWDGMGTGFQVIIKLRDGIYPSQIEAQFPNVIGKYTDDSDQRTHILQSIQDIHYNADFQNFDRNPTHKPTLYGLLIVGVLLLLLGCTNFINLTTSTNSKRTKEINIRKTLGSLKTQLAIQFLIETFLTVFLATIASFLIIPVIFQVFKEFIPDSLVMNSLFELQTLGFIFILMTLIGVFSGMVPIYAFAKLKPAGFWRNPIINIVDDSKKLREVLIVFQFVISFTLIVSTLFVIKQIRFSINKDPGYSRDAIITFRPPYHTDPNKKYVLLEELKAIPEIQKISMAGQPLMNRGASTKYKFQNGSTIHEIGVDIFEVDSTFLDIYRLKIIAGYFPQSDSSKQLLTNRTFTKKIGLSTPESAIGEFLVGSNGDEIQIVGVVEDFHSKSTHYSISPIVLNPMTHFYDYYHIKLSGNDNYGWQSGIQKIASEWNRVYPDSEFEYQFIDDKIAAMYKSEQDISKLLSWASGLTVFISCLGLLGLAVFMANQRTKEIGIRKVNGAKISEILTLLNKDFIKWVLSAFVIATPIAWYAMNKWLENFAYKTELSWWVFALAGLIALGVALLTVSFQSWKAATRNPVEALRYE